MSFTDEPGQRITSPTHLSGLRLYCGGSPTYPEFVEEGTVLHWRGIGPYVVTGFHQGRFLMVKVRSVEHPECTRMVAPTNIGPHGEFTCHPDSPPPLPRRNFRTASAVVRVLPGTQVPATMPDDPYDPGRTHPVDFPWKGQLLVLTPGALRVQCARDFVKYSDLDELEQTWQQFWWGSLPVIELAPDLIINWHTRELQPGYELVFESYEDYQVAFDERYPLPKEG